MLLKTIYTQLKQTLDDDTTDQAESITRQQVTSILGTDVFTQTMLANAKKLLARDVREENINAAMLSIKDGTISLFPDAEFENGRTGDKYFVKVWPEGRPEEVSS
jgi:hypothetical protein